jgi:ParB family chromosome partitioning protein
MTITIEQIFTDAINISDHHRALNDDKVAALAESMQTVGLLQPILVHDRGNDVPDLIAGRNRLAAAIKLGWDMIDAVMVTGDDIDIRLREITENLHRAELTV